MQRLLPVATVRVVSAVTDSSQGESVLEDECGTIDEEVGMESEDMDDDQSDLESDISSPISLRVARFLESGKPSGPKKRKRAKLNHLSSEQKVERRKILNRIAAQTARDRKKVQMDELERFVKELASENLRLARENAELRQKSTEFEVENAKLRTQLERTGAHQWPVVAKQEAPSTGQFSAVNGAMRGDSRAVDNDVKPSQLARPVGIAARVNDPSAKPADSAACCRSTEETGVLEPARASNFNRLHTEAKRARVANTTECVRATQNGVSDVAQRNAAAACAGTQQQYSFARHVQALFTVLYALLVVGLRSVSPRLGLLTGHSARHFRVAAALRRAVRLPALKLMQAVSETGPPGRTDKLRKWLAACLNVSVPPRVRLRLPRRRDAVLTLPTAVYMLARRHACQFASVQCWIPRLTTRTRCTLLAPKETNCRGH